MSWDDGMWVKVGLFEFVGGIVLILIGIAWVICMAMLIRSLADSVSKNGWSYNPDSFEWRDRQVQQCLASERYTKDQCITLLGVEYPAE